MNIFISTVLLDTIPEKREEIKPSPINCKYLSLLLFIIVLLNEIIDLLSLLIKNNSANKYGISTYIKLGILYGIAAINNIYIPNRYGWRENPIKNLQTDENSYGFINFMKTSPVIQAKNRFPVRYMKACNF